MKFWKIIGILAIVGILSGIAIYFYVMYKPHKSYLHAEPEHVLSAQALYEEFNIDEAAATAKYIDKVIQVDGIISIIDDLDSTLRIGFIFNQGMFGDEGVRCTLDKSFQEEARSLATGMQVTLKGICFGKSSDVELGQCSIIK